MDRSFGVLLVVLAYVAEAWHAYNYSYSRLPDRTGCPAFADATRPYKPEFIERLSLWPGMMSPYDMEYGETLYGSEAALEMVWKSQNPDDCSTAKFLVSGGWPYGFGSRIHMEGAALAIAMQLGRVYLPHPDGDNFFWETFIDFCRNSKRHEPGMNCFYAPYSKCTIKDATVNVGGDVNKLRTYYMGDFRSAFADEGGLAQMIRTLDTMKGINIIMTYGGGPYDLKTYIPHQVRPLIDCSPMKPGLDFYYWRAISATFIARPAKEAVEELNKIATLPIQDFADVISVFVRHGDKGMEMKLMEFPQYAAIVQLLWDRGLVPLSAKYIQEKQIEIAATDTMAGGGSGSGSGDGGNVGSVATVIGTAAPGRRRLRTRSLAQTAAPTESKNTDVFTRPHGGAKQPSQRYGTNGTNTSHDKSSRYSSPHPFQHEHQHRYQPPRHLQDRSNLYGAPIERALKDPALLASLPRVPFNGTLLLSTEDPKVIDEANAWGKENHWTVVYTNLFDRSIQTAVKNWEEQHRKGTVAVHDKLEYLSMMLNLYYSVRSEAYVCTMRSNSCRIIDEMRATVGAKANRFFADISVESCPHPPCLDHEDQIVNWGE